MADGPGWCEPRGKECNTRCNQRSRLGESNEVLECQNKKLEVDVGGSVSIPSTSMIWKLLFGFINLDISNCVC